jgi:hypothetical protein
VTVHVVPDVNDARNNGDDNACDYSDVYMSSDGSAGNSDTHDNGE